MISFFTVHFFDIVFSMCLCSFLNFISVVFSFGFCCCVVVAYYLALNELNAVILFIHLTNRLEDSVWSLWFVLCDLFMLPFVVCGWLWFRGYSQRECAVCIFANRTLTYTQMHTFFGIYQCNGYIAKLNSLPHTRHDIQFYCYRLLFHFFSAIINLLYSSLLSSTVGYLPHM